MNGKLSEIEQRVARAAGRLAADALVYDYFPDCHIGGGSSYAHGWEKGHRTEWDRKGFRIEIYDLQARKPVTVASVTWRAVRQHGRAMPALCAEVKSALAEAVAVDRTYSRAVNYHRKGDPDAQAWASGTFGPINQPAIDAAWEQMLTDSDTARTRLNDLLDQAFPLASEIAAHEPTDLLELLAAMP